MRIAVVCPYDLGVPGGVQQVAIELVERMNERGHTAWLVGPGRRANAETVGSTVRIRGNDSVAPVALGVGVPRRVRAALAFAEVVHIHEPLMPRVSTAALTADLPRVVTFHADAPRWAARLYRRVPGRWERAISNSVVTAVSPVAAAAIPESFGSVEVIPNGLDVSAFPRVDKVPNRVTFLGRDEPRKGLRTLLEAWPAVRSQVPDAELFVMGAERDAAAPGVRLLGRVDEATKREMLASAVIHVAPNTGGESFGIVVAEAMAAGAAVIASDIPAFTAVLADTGVQVPPGRADLLGDAIVALLGQPDRAAALGQAARTRVVDYDWPAVVDRYITAYERARG